MNELTRCVNTAMINAISLGYDAGFKDGDQFYCHRSKEDIVKTDKYGWCNYTGSDIIAWIRLASFKEILEMNKDVLMRLKDM